MNIGSVWGPLGLLLWWMLVLSRTAIGGIKGGNEEGDMKEKPYMHSFHRTSHAAIIGALLRRLQAQIDGFQLDGTVGDARGDMMIDARGDMMIDATALATTRQATGGR